MENIIVTIEIENKKLRNQYLNTGSQIKMYWSGGKLNDSHSDLSDLMHQI